MNYSEKSALINSLAKSVGVEPLDTKKYGTARYESSTGTLYCEGLTLPHSSIEEIKDWYQQQMIIYQRTCHESSDYMTMYMRYALAYNAICLLKDNMNDDTTS